MDTRVDVLIVGAGPAGSATACLLSQAGLDVLVADRATFPRDKPCAEYMSPSSVDMLDRLGVASRLEAGGANPISGTTVIAAGGASLTGLYAQTGPSPLRLMGLSVARILLDATLVDEARRRGATVLEGTRVMSVERQGSGVSGAVLRSPSGAVRKVRASVTVGADGLRSVVARAFGRRISGPLRRWAFVTHMSGIEQLHDRAELHLGTHGYVGLNPIGGGITNVSLVVPQRWATPAKRDLAAFFSHSLEQFPQVRDRIRWAKVVGEIRATGPFAIRSSRPVIDGGLLVGDAAEFFDPFTGDGIHAALRGAELASAAIVAAIGQDELVPAKALRSYLQARRRTFAGKWMVERMIGYGMLAPRLFDRAVGRIGSKPPMAHTMIGVTGHVVPPTAVLNPKYLARMII
ncbi:MAG: NAD(P)/FAD-dependent oxidoreductase [Gemmatimonadales bacterium]